MRRTRSLVALPPMLALTLVLASCAGDEESGLSAVPTSPGEGAGPVLIEPNPTPGITAEPEEDAASTEEGAPGDSTSEDGEPVSAEPSSVPEIGEIGSAEVSEVAAAYIEARENRVSHTMEAPEDWLDVAEPFLTEEAHERMLGEINPEGSLGSDWYTAHDEGLAVEVTVEDCGVNVASGVDEEDRKMVQCAVSNTLVDEDGEPIPTTQIPAGWTAVGPQPAAMLLMVQEDGSWLVSDDYTGRAS